VLFRSDVNREDQLVKLRQREAELRSLMETKRLKREIDVQEKLQLHQAKKLTQARQLLDGLRQADSEQAKIVSDLRTKKSQLLLQAAKADLYRVDLMAELASARSENKQCRASLLTGRSVSVVRWHVVSHVIWVSVLLE